MWIGLGRIHISHIERFGILFKGWNFCCIRTSLLCSTFRSVIISFGCLSFGFTYVSNVFSCIIPLLWFLSFGFFTTRALARSQTHKRLHLSPLAFVVSFHFLRYYRFRAFVSLVHLHSDWFHYICSLEWCNFPLMFCERNSEATGMRTANRHVRNKRSSDSQKQMQKVLAERT